MDIWEIFLMGFVLLSIAGTVFWIYMLIDCSTQETGQDKWMWIIILVITHGIGALVYYYYQRPKRLHR